MTTIIQVPPPPPRSAQVLQGALAPPQVQTQSLFKVETQTESASGTPIPATFVQPWAGWFRRLFEVVNANFAAVNAALPPAGFSGTIATAKLTPGGVNGSMTFTNGILTAQTAAT